jgi:hypothetical protein
MSPRVHYSRGAPLSGTEEQTARAISAHAQYACLLSLQMGSINKTRLGLCYQVAVNDLHCVGALRASVSHNEP